MDLRKKLLQHKPKVTEIEILGEKYYVRALSVGEPWIVWPVQTIV